MIQEGLLWFDDSNTRPVAEKIARAAARYQQKYHHDPNVCFIHLGEGEADPAGSIKVIPSKSVFPHHFWLGIETTKKAKSGAKS